MALHNRLGTEGEHIALDYLSQKGYHIRHTNWRHAHLELDIVAENDDYLVIAEVKTRRSSRWIHPAEAVGERKIQRLVDAAQAYIQQYNVDKEIRFDIIAIIKQGDHLTIEHLEDAFLPPIT